MDWIFHILLPLGLLTLFGIRNKWIFWLLPLTVILDIGTIFAFRRGFHSIFIVLAIILIIYAVCRLKKTKETKTIVGISAFYVISHMLLDIGGPMALLWPLVTDAYTLTIKILMEGMIPRLVFAVNTIPIQTLEQYAGGLVTEAGFGFLFVFIIMLAAKKLGMIKNDS